MLISKLTRNQGLCTSVHNSDDENRRIITLILNCFMNGMELHRANRNEDNWSEVDGMPMNFEDYRFRTVLVGLSLDEWIEKWIDKIISVS